MSVYETQAEQKNYFVFVKREALKTFAHFHGAIELLVCAKGAFETTIGGETLLLREGEGCFVDCFDVHAIEGNSDALAYIVLLPREVGERILKTFDGKTPPKHFYLHDFELLDFLEKICKREYDSQEAQLLAFEGAMTLLFSAIAQNNVFLPQKTNKQNVLVCDILRYADKRLTEDLSLRAIAQAFGYSQEHLSRLLNKTLCESWSSYVNRLRVKKARMLLQENPHCSVLEIALICGFESPNTFYRAYKKEYGAPPKRI